MTIQKNEFVCSCFYLNQWGLPCKHIICVKSFLQDTVNNVVGVLERWKKTEHQISVDEVEFKLNEFLLMKSKEEKEKNAKFAEEKG